MVGPKIVWVAHGGQVSPQGTRRIKVTTCVLKEYSTQFILEIEVTGLALLSPSSRHILFAMAPRPFHPYDRLVPSN